MVAKAKIQAAIDRVLEKHLKKVPEPPEKKKSGKKPSEDVETSKKVSAASKKSAEKDSNTSPKASKTSPKASKTSPKASKTSPKAPKTSVVKAPSAPKMASPTPTKASRTPKKASRTPKKASPTLAKASPTPTKASPTPTKASPTPTKASPTPTPKEASPTSKKASKKTVQPLGGKTLIDDDASDPKAEKAAADKLKNRGPTVYKCVACEEMTKVRSPTCRCCGLTNGYRDTPPGTRLPKKRHGAIKQAGGFGKNFSGDDFGLGGGGGKSKSDDDDDDFDPDDVPEVTPIGEVEVEERVRISTGIPALNRVLGGNDEEGHGIVAGSSVMIDGPPGIGKSTLLIQTVAKMSEYGTVLYITGEEAASDIRARANRLKILTKKALKNILVIEATDTDFVIDTIEEEEPVAVILDSIQMFYSENASGQAGSEPQCKYILEEMIRATCKPMGIALFLVSQVTKDGDQRGPMTIAHMVDAHLKFESADPKNRGEIKRVLYQKKNRNGDISTIGYFKMTSEGLVGLKEKPGQSINDIDERETTPMSAFGL